MVKAAIVGATLFQLLHLRLSHFPMVELHIVVEFVFGGVGFSVVELLEGTEMLRGGHFFESLGKKS